MSACERLDETIVLPTSFINKSCRVPCDSGNDDSKCLNHSDGQPVPIKRFETIGVYLIQQSAFPAFNPKNTVCPTLP